MKMYTYYVASFNRWKILTVRIVNRRNGEFLSDLEEVNEVEVAQ